MQKIGKAILTIYVIAALTGCASVMNPYSSDFSCPQSEKGKCVSVSVAYKESLTGESQNPFVKSSPTNPSSVKDCVDCTKDARKSKGTVSADDVSPEDSYQEAVFKRMTGLLRDPVTPIISPPQVLRVLLLAYRGDNNELFMPRYSYVVIDEPKWVLDNEIIETGE